MSGCFPSAFLKAFDSGIGSCSKVEMVWCGQMRPGSLKARRRLSVAEMLRVGMTMKENVGVRLKETCAVSGKVKRAAELAGNAFIPRLTSSSRLPFPKSTSPCFDSLTFSMRSIYPSLDLLLCTEISPFALSLSVVSPCNCGRSPELYMSLPIDSGTLKLSFYTSRSLRH